MLKTCRFPLEKGIKKLDKITKKLLEVLNCFPGEVHPAQCLLAGRAIKYRGINERRTCRAGENLLV
jgi:hypothetical protein